MPGFDYKDILFKFRYPLFTLLIGIILIGIGGFLYISFQKSTNTQVEVLSQSDQNYNPKSITVEIAGEVANPGVYKLDSEGRVDDLLILAGGFTASSDRVWTDKYLNRAAKLEDGQKIYIPSTNQHTNNSTASNYGGDQSVSSGNLSENGSLININTSSLDALMTLSGIGQKYAQNIVEHRPYSTASELVSKGAIKQSLYEKIKDKITIY